MYRRPKSLDVLLGIRAAMSAESGLDMRSFVELIRTGAPLHVSRTVTFVEGDRLDDAPTTVAAEIQKAEIAGE